MRNDVFYLFNFVLLNNQVELNFLVESEGAADNVSLQIALLEVALFEFGELLPSAWKFIQST